MPISVCVCLLIIDVCTELLRCLLLPLSDVVVIATRTHTHHTHSIKWGACCESEIERQVLMARCRCFSAHTALRYTFKYTYIHGYIYVRISVCVLCTFMYIKNL